MTRFLVATTKADAIEVRRIARTIFALPWTKYIRVGGGIQAPALSVQDYLQPIKHPTQQMWAVEITQDMKDTWQQRKSLLSAAERAFIQSLLTSEQELDPSWDGALVDS